MQKYILTTNYMMMELNIWCMLRTDKAIAYAEQISKVEAFRPDDAFSDAIKGLLVFGGKIVRPEQLYIIKSSKII